MGMSQSGPPWNVAITGPGLVYQDPTTGALVGAGGDVLISASDMAAVAGLAPSAMPPELQPTNWFSDQLFSGGHGYLYGRSISNFLDFVRVDPLTRTRTVTANPFGVSSPQTIRTVVTTSVPGLIFACIGESGQTVTSMRIWRSTNYGATWAQVLALGSGPGGAANGVWMLSDRNFCEGDKGWYIGEYNVNSSRTSGGANDGVTLWRSTDQGATWQAAQTWNTGGAHQLRHIHCVKRSPLGGIVIGTGDTDAESALIWWDEVGTIGNVAFSALPSGSRALHGRQRHRVVDLDAVDGYWYWMGDGPSQDVLQLGEVGWFRCPVDLSSPVERLDGQIAGYTQRSIYYSVKLSNGCLAYIEETIADPGAGNYHIGVWVSNESRTRIERAGIIKYPNTVTTQVAPAMFQVGDEVFAWCSGTAFAKSGGTAAFTTSSTKRFCGRRPDVLHPVYWCDPVNGTDSAAVDRAFYPGAAVKTLGNVLTSSYLPRGGRLMLPAGEFSTSETANFNPRFSTTGADTTDFFTIDGQGINATKIGLAAGASAGNHINMPAADPQRMEFKDFQWTTYRDVSGQIVLATGGASVAHVYRFIRCRIGGHDVASQITPINSNLIAGGSNAITSFDSEIVARPGGYPLITGDVDGPTSITADNTVFSGGTMPFSPRSTDTISIKGGLICDASVSGGTIDATANASVANTLSIVGTRYALPINVPQIVNSSGGSITGRAVGCKSVNALNPSGLFDATSAVDVQTAPRDPFRFDFSESV